MKLRITLLVLAIGSLILVSFMIPLALLVRTFAADQAISKANTDARLLAPLVATLSPVGLARTLAQVSAQDPADQITIFLPGGRQIGAPAARSDDVRAAAAGKSIPEPTPAGIVFLWAVQGLPHGGTAVIRTFVPNSALRHGVARAWMLLGLLALALLGLAAAVAAQLSRSLVRPLATVASVSEQLAEGQLAARALVAGPPEVRQVSTALNRLATRIGELLAHERETVADLSHRLRTPLTALRVEAESLRDADEMQRVIGSVDEITRTVNEIITEARRPTADTATATCDAAAVVAERAEFWRALAEDQNRWMSVEVSPASLPVRVPASDLVACVDILLENVFAHTAEGTALAVRVSARPAGGAWLDVWDNGPGFSGPGQARRGHSGGGSTGLGLDIARRIAERAGGALTLGRSPAGGAAVTIGFGPPYGLERGTRRQVRPHLTVRAGRAGHGGARPADLMATPRGDQNGRAISPR